jgi:hypothetical protein
MLPVPGEWKTHLHVLYSYFEKERTHPVRDSPPAGPNLTRFEVEAKAAHATIVIEAMSVGYPNVRPFI